jgi:hypothetical protein
MVCSAMVLGWA